MALVFCKLGVIRGTEEVLDSVDVIMEPKRGNWWPSRDMLADALDALFTVSNTFLYGGLQSIMGQLE